MKNTVLTHTIKPNNVPGFANTTVYNSDIVRIINYECGSTQSFVSKPELSGYFSVGFIRTGSFHFKSYRHSTDLFTSRVLIEKPQCEYRLIHHGNNYNATTFFIFTESFYKALINKFSYQQHNFLNNQNILSLLLLATPELELLHYSIWQKIHQQEIFKLEIDSMVIELITILSEILSLQTSACKVDKDFNKNHLQTIERAKEYILKNFITRYFA